VFAIARHLPLSQLNSIHLLKDSPRHAGAPTGEYFWRGVHKLRIIFGEGIPRWKTLCVPEPYLGLFQWRHSTPYRLATLPAAGLDHLRPVLHVPHPIYSYLVSHYLSVYGQVFQMVSFPPVHYPRKPCITSPLLSPIRATCPDHLIVLDLLTRTIFGEQYRSFISSLCSVLHFPVTSSLLGTNILLSILFSNTFSLHYSLNVTDQVSHPYKTRGNITYQEFSHIHTSTNAKFVNVTNCSNSWLSARKSVRMGVFDTCLLTFHTTTHFELPPSFRSRSTIDYNRYLGHSEILYFLQLLNS